MEMRVSRRDVLAGGGALAGLGAISGAAGAATKTLPAPYVRYDVWSPDGQRMLKGYATAIRTMLAKPASHPHNWFQIGRAHV
jgi:tyrosinase